MRCLPLVALFALGCTEYGVGSITPYAPPESGPGAAAGDDATGEGPNTSSPNGTRPHDLHLTAQLDELKPGDEGDDGVTPWGSDGVGMGRDDSLVPNIGAMSFSSDPHTVIPDISLNTHDDDHGNDAHDDDDGDGDDNNDDDGDTGGQACDEEIEVTFHCDQVHVVSCCHDLSNVVVLYADLTWEKFDGLHGECDTFGEVGGDEIIAVWVKAGNNASGDGAGWGEPFESDGSCGEDTEPPPDECACDEGYDPANIAWTMRIMTE